MKYHGYEMLVHQSGGNFPKLMFSEVPMDGVCCEIIGTYNALTLANIKVDYFKLAIEFEMNAMLSYPGTWKSGYWGSNPDLIDNCLDAYNVTYTTIDVGGFTNGIYQNKDDTEELCEDFDDELKFRKSAIIFYRWKKYGINAPIHTYATIYDSNNTENPIVTFNNIGDVSSLVRYQDTYEALNDGNDHFMIGYILK